jgi:hypothetical protein
MNQHLRCVVPDCHDHRTRFGLYCRPHRRRLSKYGSPTGRPLSRSFVNLPAQVRKVEALLSTNGDHPGFLRASSEIQRLLDEAAERAKGNRPLTGPNLHWARLANHGVTPQAILSHVVAVIALDRENERLFSTQRALEFAIARAVFGLAPISRAPLGARTLEEVGRQMIDRYGDLIVSVLVALQATADDARKREAAMQAPLQIALPNQS